jgi:hypothetical protein
LKGQKTKIEYTPIESHRNLLPDGNYEVQHISHNDGFVMGRSRKLFVIFKILETGEHYDKTIMLIYNIPFDKRPSPSSKYYKDWFFLNDYKKPSRNTKLSPNIFKNKRLLIKTRTSKPKRYGKEMPKDFWYSVVEEIVEVLTGGIEQQWKRLLPLL